MKLFWRYLMSALPLLLAVWLYAYSLRLTFTLDDMSNLLSVQATDGLSHWGGDRSFPYYRPIAFSLWKSLWMLETRPYVFYALNVFVFGLTGVWVGKLSLLPQPFAPMVGCAFVIFPFSYQAVLWVSSFFHLSLAFFLAFSLWSGGRWLASQKKGWLILSWLAGMASIFSHENGVIVGALVTGYWLMIPPKRPQFALLSLPIWGLSLLYFVLWNLVPRAAENSPQPHVIPNDFPILLHGLVYPFDALIQMVVRWRGDAALPNEQPAQAVWVLLLVILIPALAFLWRRKRLWAGLIGLGWYAVAILPSVLNFNAVYLLGSPRLMVVASLGACWFWGVLIFELWQTNWGKILAGGLITLTVLVSLPFLAARQYDSLLLANYFWELEALVEDHQLSQSEHEILLLNAPNYLAPLNQTFLLGSEGNFLLLDGGDYGALYAGNTGKVPPFDTYAFERQTLKYFRGSFSANGQEFSRDELHALLRAQTHIISTVYTDNGFYPSLVKHPLAEFSPEKAVQFPETGLQLLLSQAAWADQTLVIQTVWEQANPQPVKRFLHILCQGELIAQRDGYLWNDLYPFGVWLPNEIQADRVEIRFENTLDPACVQVFTGLYWETNGQRLPTDGNFPNDAIPVGLE